MSESSQPSYIQRLKDFDRRYACFISFIAPDPLHDGGAESARRGQGGPVPALTVAIKDCIDVAGVRGTWGSNVNRDRIALGDAAVVASLRAAGATMVATTNLHEFAFGGTTQNPHFGNCRNAWRDDRVPGGSSGGSAVAVALGLCDVSLGTDTGASVRMPASLNGVIGFRPTHGSVSSRGVMPVSPPHDTVGVLGRDIDVVRRVFDTIHGFDPHDPYSQTQPLATDFNHVGSAAVRLGVATALVDGCDPAVVKAFDDSLRVCRDQGYRVANLGSSSFADVAFNLSSIVIADAASFHRERLANQPEHIGVAIHSRIARGLTMPAIEYAGHLRWLESYRHEVMTAFRDVDFIVAPTVPVSPPLIVDCDNAVAVTQMLSRNCWLAPAAGLPAITLPCGIDDNGIPIGFQIVGRRWSDLQLLALAETLQRALPAIGRPADYMTAAPTG